MATRHVNIRVEGGVQGVGFRWAARTHARIAGVRGFVRNEDDGSVYIEAEGSDGELEYFMAWCRRGPPSGWVNHVSIEPGAMKGYTEFEIRM